MYALVDCNNFYVSCERLFNPKLEGKAVIILSSNDGCVVARSEEAKRLEIYMGQPLFECKHIVDVHRVQVFSSNFPLYGDISKRVMSTISAVVPDIEIYSIDEAFLLVDHWLDPTTQAHALRARIRQDVGIPVSIGIAPTIFRTTSTISIPSTAMATMGPEVSMEIMSSRTFSPRRRAKSSV
jgi:DNA polymerase V